MNQVITNETPRDAAVLPRTLDELAALSPAELEALYAKARTPARIAALDGDLVGRMLAVRGTRGGPLARVLAAVAAHAAFPWGGKSFVAQDAEHGSGINRVRLFGKHRLFPFTTRVAPSALDGAPSVVLDYDDPDNPDLIRAIHDEVREIVPGLFFGPACWKREGQTPAVVLWFALDARDAHRATA